MRAWASVPACEEIYLRTISAIGDATAMNVIGIVTSKSLQIVHLVYWACDNGLFTIVQGNPSSQNNEKVTRTRGRRYHETGQTDQRRRLLPEYRKAAISNVCRDYIRWRATSKKFRGWLLCDKQHQLQKNPLHGGTRNTEHARSSPLCWLLDFNLSSNPSRESLSGSAFA
jgi:hypothetical protein